MSIFLARKGNDKETIRKEISERFNYDLNRTIDEIRPDYHFNESCQETVPEAIIAFLDSDDYEHSIRLAVSLGGDIRVKSIMIEVNRNLYMDESTGRKNSNFNKVKNEIKIVLEEIMLLTL